MSDRPVIAFAASHLKRNCLSTSQVLGDISNHGRFAHRGRAHGDLAVVLDEQHAIKSVRFASFSFETLDFERVACSYAILFSTSFYDGIHIRFLKGMEIPTKTGVSVNHPFTVF